MAGYKALQAAAETREVRALRVTFPNGSTILYNGYVSFNETPSMTKGEVMGVQATFSLLSRPMRYAAGL
ncbi:Phage tail protein [compost metagenome]